MSSGLTVRYIENLKPIEARREIADGLLTGLYLVVQPSGRKSWAVRYRFAGRPKKYTIPGSYPAIDLATARELGKAALRAVAEGRDPAAEKREGKRAGVRERDTFEKIAEQFIERYAKANTRESSWRETERLLKADVTPHWRGRAVTEIAKRDIIDLLDRKIDAGSPTMANRIFATVRRLFGWCVERGVLEASPCAGIKPPAPEKSRDRVLSDDELRLVWNAASGLDWPFGPMTQLLILTAQRREEVAGIHRAELDLAGRLWTIPRERAKNDVAHHVPLSKPVLAILEALPQVSSRSGLMFTTTGDAPVSGYSRAKARIDAVLPDMPHWTIHDLRRTAASGMARLGVQMPVVEKILNHVSGSFSGVAGVYQRHDFAEEKRAALEAWASFVMSIVTGSPKSNVVSLKRTGDAAA